MVIIHVHLDDNTYVDGDMECELDEDKNGIEPFIYRDESRTVECYLSRNLFIERGNDERISKVVHTGTCWSDDYDEYTIEDGKVVYEEGTEHGMNRVYITYECGVIADIKYSRKVFGMYKIGDSAPVLHEIMNRRKVI
jgi:hypothetical protein